MDDSNRDWVIELFECRHRVRDLYLKYHPDKKPHGNAEAFCYLKDTIEHLNNVSETWATDVSGLEDLEHLIGGGQQHSQSEKRSTYGSNKQEESFDDFIARISKSSPTIGAYTKTHPKECWQAFWDACEDKDPLNDPFLKSPRSQPNRSSKKQQQSQMKVAKRRRRPRCKSY